MLKVFFDKKIITVEDIKLSANYGGQDIFSIVPFLNESLYYDVLVPCLGRHNESLYTQMYYTGTNIIQHVDNIHDCDICVLPFRFNIEDKRVYEICKYAKEYNKKVVCFFTSDITDTYNLPDNLILFRTSIYKSKKQNNERVMPALHPEHFCNFTENVDNKISFCGQLTTLRNRIVQSILKINVPTDFIYRQGFWAPEVGSKIKARKQYYANLSKNRYTLCIRGEGNFSFRFYEALSFGRIPILIDTDNDLPFNNIIDWSKHIIRIQESEIPLLPRLLEEDNRCMMSNREMWREYLSVNGYTKNFIKDL